MEFVYLKEMVSDFGCVLKNAIEDGFTIYVRASSFDSNKVFLTGQYHIDNPVSLATDDVFNRRRGETVLEVSWRASAKIVRIGKCYLVVEVFTHLFCYNIGTLAFASSLIKACFQVYIGSLKEDIFGLVFSETQYLVLFKEVYHRAHLTNVHSIASIDYQKLLVDASSRRGKDVQKADGLNNLDGIGYGCGICIESLCSFDGNLDSRPIRRVFVGLLQIRIKIINNIIVNVGKTIQTID